MKKIVVERIGGSESMPFVVVAIENTLTPELGSRMSGPEIQQLIAGGAINVRIQMETVSPKE